MEKANLQLATFQQALGRLEQTVAMAETEIVRDATIQRFEFTFELAWKLLKTLNENEGVPTQSPRESIKRAFQFGLISDCEIWLEMLEARNLVSHTYKEEVARRIYEGIKRFAPVLRCLAIHAAER